MAKPENDVILTEKQTWSTWEELLLACAVHRHGTESWNSVSAEIQKLSPNLCSLTASACRHKYFDLKSRLTQELAVPESVAAISTAPWLEELRKLRVDELRREVEQYDLSISTLQSKVKQLEEEREMSFIKPDTETENLDLERKKERSDSGEPVPNPPVQLMNETISPDPKEIGSENTEREEEMAGSGGGESKLAGEDSCRGSCESVEKEPTTNSERVEPVSVTELIESEDGASRGEEITSDVQSSASLPRKGTSEPDKEDQSPTSAKDFTVESQPLISFVEILLSHPCGSHFSRRLERQETIEYGTIIREHVDFEIIRKRVEGGLYKSWRINFFRDLLLLVNNARVFYHRGSSEFKFAEQLHQLVKKQMTTTLKGLSNRDEISISPPKEEVVAIPSSKPVSSKPRMSVPNIVACRKRSALAAKPLLLLPPGPDKKAKKTDHVVDYDEKPVSDKDGEASGKDDDDSLIVKIITRGRTSSTGKVANRNVKNRDSSLNVDDSKHKVKKTDEEKKGGSKKKGAASFLRRMKVGSSDDTLKRSSAADSSTTGKGGGAEQRKNNSNKADNKKTPIPRIRQTNKKASPVKRSNNGRNSEREAAPSYPILAKRSREAGEKEEASSYSPRLKKRARR
ncbi:unnamed protein product [Arabidopsis thaliana]|uniref:Bromo domain-containing protein n=1 Tax=Arabidopsis thaliana TaxID=3702 RepID=A0A5S9X6A2_ARATH|nr:unnamed protein product [Arabidopsis thaliana]